MGRYLVVWQVYEREKPDAAPSPPDEMVCGVDPSRDGMMSNEHTTLTVARLVADESRRVERVESVRRRSSVCVCVCVTV